MIKSGKEDPGEQMKEVITDLSQACQQYCRSTNDVDMTSPGNTQLDYERQKLCFSELV